MLYASLIFANMSPESRKIQSLEHFWFEDESYTQIKNPISTKTLIFITKLYLEADNKFKIFKDYWMFYLSEFTNSKPRIFLNDKFYSDWLLSAYLIDNKQYEKAEEILTNIEEVADFKNDMSLERIHWMLLGHVLKNNKSNHEKYMKGLTLIEKFEEIEKKDKYTEFSNFFIVNPFDYFND